MEVALITYRAGHMTQLFAISPLGTAAPTFQSHFKGVFHAALRRHVRGRYRPPLGTSGGFERANKPTPALGATPPREGISWEHFMPGSASKPLACKKKDTDDTGVRSYRSCQHFDYFFSSGILFPSSLNFLPNSVKYSSGSPFLGILE